MNTHKNKPFALLGINGDPVADAPTIFQEQNINWRSWLDDNNGPIATDWQVKTLPALYLLDHKGVIRYKNLYGDSLDRAIEKLIADAEAESEEEAQNSG